MFRILYLLFLQLGIAFNLPNCELGYEVDQTFREEEVSFIIQGSLEVLGQIIAINNNYFHQNGVFQTVNFTSMLDCGINLELSPGFFSLVKERKTRIQQKIANCISCSKGTNFLVKNVLLSHVCAHMCVHTHIYFNKYQLEMSNVS